MNPVPAGFKFASSSVMVFKAFDILFSFSSHSTRATFCAKTRHKTKVN